MTTRDPSGNDSRVPKRRERKACPCCGRYIPKVEMLHLPAYLGGIRVETMRGKLACRHCVEMSHGPENEDPIVSARRARGME
jgi:hypothetical protein